MFVKVQIIALCTCYHMQDRNEDQKSKWRFECQHPLARAKHVALGKPQRMLPLY